ncbi:thyrostimulin alpha-2 subunit isoform X1 [Neodiprion virginianus]|uniref:thyrostimulin alpha-2 subunit isoform X1 n=1 Tax=Neodiprion virginianus TaxID=2961670 RepID=UPI001EE72E33|nr:thyrostimulin alpha-2 subunit isoform X1 [Neodiprion virginianus]
MGSIEYCWCRWTSVMGKTGRRVIYFLLLVSCTAIIGQEVDSQPPKCLLVGYEMNITLKNCPGMSMVGINVCRGYCESIAFPTNPEIRSKYPQALITSNGGCCSIKEYVNFTTTVPCGSETKKVTLPSATSCWCHDCINS